MHDMKKNYPGISQCPYLSDTRLCHSSGSDAVSTAPSTDRCASPLILCISFNLMGKLISLSALIFVDLLLISYAWSCYLVS